MKNHTNNLKKLIDGHKSTGLDYSSKSKSNLYINKNGFDFWEKTEWYVPYELSNRNQEKTIIIDTKHYLHLHEDWYKASEMFWQNTFRPWAKKNKIKLINYYMARGENEYEDKRMVVTLAYSKDIFTAKLVWS